LGLKLVEALTLQKHDLLGQWMAHYVAEKLKLAANAKAEDRALRMSECYDEVLKLWAHRRNFETIRPLQSFDPIFRALACLDPEATLRSRFFDNPIDDDEIESEICRSWLDKASAVEKAACALIKKCVWNAAQDAMNQEQEWVKNALNADLSKDDDDLSVIKFFELEPIDSLSFSEQMEQLISLVEEAIANLPSEH